MCPHGLYVPKGTCNLTHWSRKGKGKWNLILLTFNKTIYFRVFTLVPPLNLCSLVEFKDKLNTYTKRPVLQSWPLVGWQVTIGSILLIDISLEMNAINLTLQDEVDILATSMKQLFKRSFLYKQDSGESIYIIMLLCWPIGIYQNSHLHKL